MFLEIYVIFFYIKVCFYFFNYSNNVLDVIKVFLLLLIDFEDVLGLLEFFFFLIVEVVVIDVYVG